MSYIGLVNDPLIVGGSTNWSASIYAMKTFLTGLPEPWVVIASGDGTNGNYNPSGDTIDSAAEMHTVGSWFLIRPPNSGYQLCFEMVNTGTGAGRVSISMMNLFADGGGSKGAASATEPWGAPDENFFFGTATSTDNYPTSGSPANVYGHIVTSDEPIEGHYPLYLMYSNTAGSGLIHCYGVDVMYEATRHPSHPKNIIALETSIRGRANFFEDPADGTTAIQFSTQLEGRSCTPLSPYNADGNIESDLEGLGASELMYPFYWYASDNISVQSGTYWNGTINFNLGMSVGLRIPDRSNAHNYPDRSNPGTADERVYSGDDMLIPWPQGNTPLS